MLLLCTYLCRLRSRQRAFPLFIIKSFDPTPDGGEQRFSRTKSFVSSSGRKRVLPARELSVHVVAIVAVTGRVKESQQSKIK